MPSLSVAKTLMLEDQLKGIVTHDKKLKYRQKCAGLIPVGSHSPLGDFPRDYKLPNRPKITESPSYSRTHPIKPTIFKTYLDRGDIPARVSHAGGCALVWSRPIESIDYNQYLPVFIDGIREQEEPGRFIAVQGTFDLLQAAMGSNKVAQVVPQLVLPLKAALDCRDVLVISTAMKCMQAMLKTHEKVGLALVPYFKQLLPAFNRYKTAQVNSGDLMQYGQRKGLCLGDLVEDTLAMLEEKGGKSALINIKYTVPTYESVVDAGHRLHAL